MKHHIIVKFNSEGKTKDGIFTEITELFRDVTEIEGIHGVTFHPSVTDRPNRYDLMIRIDMEPEALPRFDASELHLLWKEQYSRYLEAKAIFDCD